MEAQTTATFPDEALQHVLLFIDTHTDRNSVSLVCRSWYDIERCCRRNVFIGNSYALSPSILIRRFTDVRSITIKGKHLAADYDFIPDGWGAHALPWIVALADAYPAMEEIRMKRMVVTDEGLDLIGTKLMNIRNLILRRCDGFSTHGLASIASNCRNLRMLDLSQSEIDDTDGNWVSHFPDSYTSLEFFNVDRLKSELPFSTLERLVSRSPNLKALRLNHSFPLEKLVKLLMKAPQLVDLGIGLFTMESSLEDFTKLAEAFARCKRVQSLSGMWDVNPYYLPAIYIICPGLTSLNLQCSTLRCPDLVQLLRHCPNLQCLWVLDYIGDRGLEEVAASCKKLEELRVLFSDPYDTDPSVTLTEKGLVSIAVGCTKLRSIVYFCNQMTNIALLTIAKHMPNLSGFWLCIREPQQPDYLTGQSLDIGFAAIVEHCKSLKCLVISGLVTDRLLEHIGNYGKKLEVLWLIFGGNSNMGLHHILSGCKNLRKLWIRDCPFSGEVLLANSDKLERMRFLWMFTCGVSYRACKLLAEKHPRLNVEVINEIDPLNSMSDESPVENIYVYRSVAGPRLDKPAFVQNANQVSLEELHL